MSEAEYIEPTPEGRRKLVRYLISAVSAGLFLAWAQPKFYAWLKTLPACDALPWYRGLLIAATFLPVLGAAMLLPQAIRMVAFGQSPTAGTPVFRRTRIRRGKAVKVQGAFMLGLSLLCAAVPLYGAHALTQMPFFSADAQARACAPVGGASTVPGDQAP